MFEKRNYYLKLPANMSENDLENVQAMCHKKHIDNLLGNKFVVKNKFAFYVADLRGSAKYSKNRF